MTYKDDLLVLGSGPDHLIMMDGTVIDEGVGAGAPESFLTVSGMTQGGGPPLCRDVLSSVASANNNSRLEMSDSTNVNQGGQTQRTMGGFFRVDSIPFDPTCIYKEGGGTNNIAIVLLLGNTVTFQAVGNGQFFLQIYGDRTIQPSRTYHFCFRFDGNGGANEFAGFLDGVKLNLSNPAVPAPDQAEMPSHGADINWGDSDSNLRVGQSTTIPFACPDPGFWNGWATWTESLSDTDILYMFERGVIADFVVTADTVDNMQAQLDTIANTVRSDAAAAIEIQQATNATDFTLKLDNITFDPLCSVDIIYTGPNMLTIENLNGASSSKNIAPFGGTFTTITPVSVTLNNALPGSSVLVVDDTGASFDFQQNVSGASIVISMPLGATGTWKAIASLQGYSKPVVEFDAAINNSINFTQIQNFDFDGSPLYPTLPVTSPNLSFVVEEVNGEDGLVAVFGSDIEAEIFYNMAQDYLITEAGIIWMAQNPASDPSRLTGPAGAQILVLGPNFYVRNPDFGSKVLNAFVVSSQVGLDISQFGPVVFSNVEIGLQPSVLL